MASFGSSISFDQRLYAADCIGSIAYCKGLSKIGIVTEEECVQIIDGLETVQSEWNNKSFEIKPADEDIHSANERRLGELIGSVSGKLHTGRSRNDQVATDMRIWLRTEATSLSQYLKDLLSVVVCRAEKEIDAILPGYTHLQVRNKNYNFDYTTFPNALKFKIRRRSLSAGLTFCYHMHGCGMQTLSV